MSRSQAALSYRLRFGGGQGHLKVRRWRTRRREGAKAAKGNPRESGPFLSFCRFALFADFRGPSGRIRVLSGLSNSPVARGGEEGESWTNERICSPQGPVCSSLFSFSR